MRDFDQMNTLDLSNNGIIEVQSNAFLACPKLSILNLSYNHLRTLYKGTFANQVKEALEGKGYDRVDLSAVKRSLCSLNLSYNQLQSIGKETMRDFDQMNTLDLSNNGIIEVQSNAFLACPKLSILNLSYNHLRTLYKGTFANQESYENLCLAHNAIVGLDADTFGVDNVQHLDLSNNELKKVPQHALASIRNSIATLNLKGNRIHSLDVLDFNGMNNLSELILADNHIETIEEAAFASMPKLMKLDLSHNPVVSWNPHAFKESYENLCLAHNAIVGLDADTFGVDNVQHLDLSNNELKKVPQHALASIRNSIATLNLKGNRIHSLDVLDFNGMNNLSELILADNHIETIEEAAFASMPKLMKLDLSHNPVVSWNPHAFKVSNT
uniref:Leucine-rich repeat domain-containing protein n=1 Tax=Ascaris lumbricoides TaxID=6252 RepID=A0A0M3ITZ7_ASCLU